MDGVVNGQDEKMAEETGEEQPHKVIETPAGYTEIHLNGLELWRQYTFLSEHGPVEYLIEDPQIVIFRPDGSTHRVVDSEGVVHCVPTPGFHGCVLTWQTRDGMPDYIR